MLVHTDLIYAVNIKTFGQHANGKTSTTYHGLSEADAKERAKELRQEQRYLLERDFTIGIYCENSIL